MPHPTTLPGAIFDEPTFQEGRFKPDPTGLHVPHPSDQATYNQLGKLLYTQAVAIPPSRLASDGLYSLADVYGAKGTAVVDEIVKAGHIAFHMVGDTGAGSAGKYPAEIRAADLMVADCHVRTAAKRPAFFFHLGDIVYNFGEAKYYYDEFYEPYRNYPRPILAVPGNHDSFALPQTPAGEAPLDIFQRNFCAPQPEITAEAYSLHRTALTQPGVYFAFDAPFVRIIGLFSNALEDPGVISSEGGKWAGVTDIQLDFLRAQLARIKSDRYAGAVLLAMHHPPFVYQHPPGQGKSGAHGGSLRMLQDIDSVCAETGVYPHAVLSGHAHNYQRFTRHLSLGGSDFGVPFIVCGNGGHGVLPLVGVKQAPPDPGADVGYIDAHPVVASRGLTFEKGDDRHYGYLYVTADAAQLRIEYRNTAVAGQHATPFDSVVVALAARPAVIG